MSDLEAIISEIEMAGYDWAVGRENGRQYVAVVVSAPHDYIGDAMSGQYCANGSTPYEALKTAFKVPKVKP